MSKRRTIDGEKLRSSQTFSQLTYRQRDLWQGLIEAGFDDQGRMPASPALIRSRVWPFDDIPFAEVKSDIDVLVTAGMIFRYTVNSVEYIQSINWHHYQQAAEWLGLSDFPSPYGWIDHARYHAKGGKIETLNWSTRLDTSILPSGLGSDIGSKVGSGLPTRDVKVEVNVNDEEEEHSSDLFTNTQRTIERITGIPAIPSFTTAINDLIEMEATPADIQAGYNWLVSQGKVVRYYGSLVGPTRTAMSRRIGNDHPTRGEPVLTEEALRASVFI